MLNFDKSFAVAIVALIINVAWSETAITPSNRQHVEIMRWCRDTEEQIKGCWDQYDDNWENCEESSSDILICAQEFFDKLIDQCSIDVLKKPISRLFEVYNHSSILLCQNETTAEFKKFSCWGDAWTISNDIIAPLVDGFITQDKCTYARLHLDYVISSALDDCHRGLHKYADELFQTSPCSKPLRMCSGAEKRVKNIGCVFIISLLIITVFFTDI